VTDIEKDATGPFLLYNSTRFSSLLRNFEDGVAQGKYPPLPTSVEEVDFSLLTEQVCARACVLGGDENSFAYGLQ
jgi:arginyl-tRNA synthetase